MPKAMPQAFLDALPGKQCQRCNADETRPDETTKTTTTHLTIYLTLDNARRGAAR